ncbi:hypothetical protein Enr13x_25020 [Stieleria neptunia]|uniref:Uncharacterized protein n=1 Tax=Stieleria neptunia TaxID=2527979 RepID=A0A518HP76_9BACT|nr:hypothetical protein [Stieleria neptunia]QDV42653.1 hypothetical protein Enr13x_25020 [Stieleria neptunia]
MESPPVTRGPRVRIVMRCLAWGILGVVAAECFVRSVVPFPLFYQTWFEVGIHRPDDELGFVFTPNYVGAMRHRDGAWRVPLRLDEKGFRLPVSTADNRDVARREVVLLGGGSMMFSYGLRDDQSVAAQIARHSVVPVRVQTVSQPGFDLARDFYKFKRYFEGRVHPSVVVVNAYGRHSETEVFANYSSTPSKPVGDLFWFHDNIAMNPRGLPHRIGRPFSQSYVLAGGCRLADQAYSRLPRPQDLATGQPIKNGHQGHDNSGPGETNARQHGNDLFSEMREYFERRDAKLILVFLPSNGDDRPAISNRTSPSPDQVAVLDLRGSLSVVDSDWVAAGHYGPRSAQRVGERIANAIQPLLETSDDEGR